MALHSYLPALAQTPVVTRFFIVCPQRLPSQEASTLRPPKPPKSSTRLPHHIRPLTSRSSLVLKHKQNNLTHQPFCPAQRQCTRGLSRGTAASTSGLASPAKPILPPSIGRPSQSSLLLVPRQGRFGVLAHRRRVRASRKSRRRNLDKVCGLAGSPALVGLASSECLRMCFLLASMPGYSAVVVLQTQYCSCIACCPLSGLCPGPPCPSALPRCPDNTHVGT